MPCGGSGSIHTNPEWLEQRRGDAISYPADDGLARRAWQRRPERGRQVQPGQRPSRQLLRLRSAVIDDYRSGKYTVDESMTGLE